MEDDEWQGRPAGDLRKARWFLPSSPTFTCTMSSTSGSRRSGAPDRLRGTLSSFVTPMTSSFGCQRKADADQFLHDLRERMSQFALELHPDKTRLVELRTVRDGEDRRCCAGNVEPETFDFLGFTHYCKKKRNGNFGLGRKPIAETGHVDTLKRVKEKLRERMHEDVHDTAQWLGRVVNGWLNYYAVPTSRPGSSRVSRGVFCGFGSAPCAGGHRRIVTNDSRGQHASRPCIGLYVKVRHPCANARDLPSATQGSRSRMR